MPTGPIGVFDSGVGGITVLRELKQRWPHENFIYLADTARLPYGSKSMATLRRYVEQNVQFFLNEQVKAIVIACNSASATILEEPLSCAVPIFNVVEPGARKALELSQSKRIGVLGTRATVASNAYLHVFKKLAPEAEIYQQACPLWVPLVEEGWIDDPITNLIVYRYLSELQQKHVDTLVLGCTHYPVLRTPIKRVMGQGITLVDSSLGLIEDLLNSGVCEDDVREPGQIHLRCTDFSPRLEETIRLLLGSLKYSSLKTVNVTE